MSAMSGQNRASNATLRSKDSQHFENRQMLRQTGNSMSNSSISEKRHTLQNQHSYGQMNRASSVLEGQMMAKTGSSFMGKTMLDRSNRSNVNKNKQMLQSHYGLNSNNSAFAFPKQSKNIALHSNSKMKNTALQKYEDHTALK